MKVADFNTPVTSTWCPGCGNFGLWMGLKNALVELDIPQEKLLTVFGIGCHGNGANWIKAYVFHSLHGRPLPAAIGAKLANKDLNVIAISGDGDALSEGTNHFVHACRKNFDITYLIHDNQIYALTTGQTSPTSEKGFVSKSTPFGAVEIPVNPIALAIAAGATFVARSFAGNPEHLKKMIIEAVNHKGFAVIDILQPCVTYNYLNTYEWVKEKIYDLADTIHNPYNKNLALMKAEEYEKIPIGIIYKEDRPTYEEQIPQIEKPLVKHDLNDIDIDPLIKEFM